MDYCERCGQRLVNGRCENCNVSMNIDAVMNRSSINSGNVNVYNSGHAGLCESCRNPITDKNRRLTCSVCKKVFCETCEEQFRERERKRGEKWLCEKHYIQWKDENKEKVPIAQPIKEETIEKDVEVKYATPSSELDYDFENSIEMKFKKIPPGEFMMGSEDHLYTTPVHKVKITKPFYMGIFPVTQKQWTEIMGTNNSHYKGDRRPVEKVSYEEVQTFLGKLSEKKGRKYRLPTEAEWEYACRAGTDSRYYFGDDPNDLDSYVWYSGNSGSETQNVGLKEPNGFGLYDMLGNVSEYCSDYFNEDYYSISPEIDPKGPDSGKPHVMRGGNFEYPKRSYKPKTNKLLTCAGRMIFSKSGTKTDRGHGFRVVLGT